MSWLLETRGITRSFSGIRVLNGVSLAIRAGEVHALLGENGAGKSTLMKVVAGIHEPDAGEVWLRGHRVEFRNAHDALKAGIAMIYQELLPFLDLSVAENIFMGQEPLSRFPGWIDKRALHRESEGVLSRLGIGLAPNSAMRNLRVAERQVVEIAKALAHDADLLIMDEPTSALSEHEREALFRIIGDLRQHGVAVIYISHKLDEVFRLADRVTVLRDGCHVATNQISELTPEHLIALMVGRESTELAPGSAAIKGEVALSISHLTRHGSFRDVSFEIHYGEIVGLAGLLGAGRTEILNAIYGLDPADSGEIRAHAKPLRIRSPRDALSAEIGLVTEDRKTFGLVPTLDVKRNLTLASLRRWCRSGLIDHNAENRIADEQIKSLSIKTADPHQPVDHLSGGNQQKVVFGRTLLAQPDILLLDEPTRGIDVAAKSQVHALIRRLARDGKAVLLVSSELPELFALSDRILVLRQGALVAEMETKRTTPQEVLNLAMPI
jgi:inositol transport system ATP-binding protein